jgi:hypothetical protein
MSRFDVLAALASAAVLILACGGCAELPLDNEPPEAPVLVSTGTVEPGLGVAIIATCRDPDGDRVTLQFSASSGGTVIPFEWTSFIEDGATEVFYLQLALGAWVVEAVARDELDEVGERSSIALTVHN